MTEVEERFERVLVDATNAYVQEDRDYAKYIWDQAILYAAATLLKDGRFHASYLIDKLRIKDV